MTCQLSKSQGRGNGRCIYIDIEGTFRPEKIGPIAERFQFNTKEVIENVFYARAYNSDHQNKLQYLCFNYPIIILKNLKK